MLHTRIHSVCSYSDTHCGIERRRITVTDVRENTPNSTSLEMRADYLMLKRLAAQGGCAPAILTSATIVPAIKYAGVFNALPSNRETVCAH